MGLELAGALWSLAAVNVATLLLGISVIIAGVHVVLVAKVTITKGGEKA